MAQPKKLTAEYERLRQIVDKQLRSLPPYAVPLDTRDQWELCRKIEDRATPLLRAERGVWLEAFGSPYLQMRFAGRTDGDFRDFFRSDADKKAYVAEWIRTDRRRPALRNGWFYEARAPGHIEFARFCITERGPVELRGSPTPETDDSSLHSSARNNAETLETWRGKRIALHRGDEVVALQGLAQAARLRASEREPSQPTKRPLLWDPRRDGTRCDPPAVQVAAFLGMNGSQAQLLVADAGRYRVETFPVPSWIQRLSGRLQALAVAPVEASMLREQCDLRDRLESRYGRPATVVPKRAVRGHLDRIITTKSGRKCAVVLTKTALYVVDQGKEDWRALIGRQVALSKASAGVCLRVAPTRFRFSTPGLER